MIYDTLAWTRGQSLNQKAYQAIKICMIDVMHFYFCQEFIAISARATKDLTHYYKANLKNAYKYIEWK